MATIENLLSLPNGARFYRADLHVHSFGGSHDVKDPAATPVGLVEEASKEMVHVMAIADHNDIRNVGAAIAAGEAHSVFVVPAVELSTSACHLLCYLPTLDALQRFMGKLDIADRGQSTSRCQTAVPACLDSLDGHGGFAILAHVDGPNGLESNIPGNSPHKLDILCHRALLGIELRDSSSKVRYADPDPDQVRREAGAERNKRLGLGARQTLAAVLSSDSHSRNALGRNAAGDRKITRIKMASPSFAALRIALQDADARVRIESSVPTTVPFIEAIHMEGGFSDGTRIHFNRNLNCIIGGRGAGKSTTFEAVRCLTGQPSDSPVVDSDAWPRSLYLFWRDGAGVSHRLLRRVSGSVENVDDALHGPTDFPIESFGQGETAQISKEAQSNPLALLGYLDRFIDVKAAIADENKARDELLDLQTQIGKANEHVSKIPQCEKDLAVVTNQLQALERAQAKEIIELQRKVAAAAAVRDSVLQKLREIRSATDSQGVRATADEIAQIAKPEDLVVGGKEFARIAAAARGFSGKAAIARTQMLSEFEALRSEVESQIAMWKSSESAALAEIEVRRKTLEAQRIPLDMKYIVKLASDEAALKANLVNLRTWVPHVDSLRAMYREVARRRWAARARIATMRDAYGRQITERLKVLLSDLSVSLKFRESSYSPDVEAQIKLVMNWKTAQVPRAALLVERMGVPALLEAIDKKDAQAIMGVKTDEGSSVFDKATADAVIDKLSDPATRFAIERAQVFDVPRLVVTKRMGDGKNAQIVPREFERLSLGQQQSTLLALLLASDSSAPLIIDQPEDNLDGEFIYHSLVPVLRAAKERRQIIVVTHNANIAVLGDAEQIVVMKSTSEKGSVVASGAIDDAATRLHACTILEGAREAFERRARIYGVS